MILTRLWSLIGFKVLPFGNDSGGGSGDAGQAEEARKQELRNKIDAMYGVGGTKKKQYYAQIAPNAPAWNTGTAPDANFYKGFDTPEEAHAAQLAAIGPAPANKAHAVMPMLEVDDPMASDATKQMDAEKKQIGDAARGYYTDDLGRNYQKAERSTRFRLARQGLLGSSVDSDLQGDVTSDRNLGATRVDDAVRQAINRLTTSREQERLNAVGLVNSGAGQSAVTAAQRGLENSFNNAKDADKTNLFSDLFATSANAGAASNNADYAAYLANRYRNQMQTYFPTNSQSGRVSATS